MRPSLPPDMGDNAAAQATLEARLRREQVKRVSQMEDLSNWSGNATDGQVAKYTQATGTWGPGSAGGSASVNYIVNGGAGQSIPNATETLLRPSTGLLTATGATFCTLDADGGTLDFTAAGTYLIVCRIAWPVGASPTYQQTLRIYPSLFASLGSPIEIDDRLCNSGPVIPTSRITAMWEFQIGDHLCATAFQNSGGAIPVPGFQLYVTQLGTGTG